ncbi:MAG TPA: cell division topological specificity factor MinE [Gammaproteobacteria bacterium]|nr:cell division topological specificity factor MinE [Gammaproteobacteria bacterium]
MSFLDYFRSSKKNTAQVAKERLQVVIAHQRTSRSRHDFLPDMQREVLEVIRKYIAIDEDQIQIQLEKDGDCEVLELNVTLPDRG